MAAAGLAALRAHGAGVAALTTALGDAAVKRLDAFAPREIATLAGALANLGRPHKGFLGAIGAMDAQQLRAFNASDVVEVRHSFGPRMDWHRLAYWSITAVAQGNSSQACFISATATENRCAVCR